MHAPPKDTSIPEITDPSVLEQYDAFLMGIPTRYGNFPAQWRAFWDNTGKQWSTGGFWGKYAGLFVSTGTQGGGQESTALAAMSTLAHHGIIYVPLGYKTVFPLLGDNSEVRGGSAWGAGTFSVSPSTLRSFYENATNNFHRTVTAPASPPRRSWRSLPPRARPSTRLCPRSASSDCKVGKTSKTPQLRLPLLLATEA